MLKAVLLRTVLASFLWLIAAAVGAAPLDDLKRFTRDLKTLSGAFTQQQFDRQGKQTRQLSGRFVLARGGKFRLNYEKPFAQVITSDGIQMASFDADLNQVVIRKVAQSLQATPLELLLGEIDLDAAYQFRDVTGPTPLQWLAAVAKKPEGSGVDEIRLGWSGSELKALSWRDAAGQVSVMSFTSLERNAALPESSFKVTIPAGAEVVGG